MAENVSAYRGCLLGLAVGDAMGLPVDDKNWDEICAAYGPNGLLGYDLVNGNAEITSYTQLAVYACNGLMVGLTRGRVENALEYIKLGLAEWTRSQLFYRDPEPSLCWVAKMPSMRTRRCRDSRMLDVLRRKELGSPEKPGKTSEYPGALTTAVAAGMFFDERRLTPARVGRLGAEAVALTHGSPETFLTGALLSYIIAGILHDQHLPLEEQFLQAARAVDSQFRGQFREAADLAQQVEIIVAQALETEDPRAGMENLHCDTAAQCLMGAIFACLNSPDDFDTAMILAVNHSGRSAAVGALTGAILGAKLGEEALPEFYLESLEQRQILEVLAKDMAQGSITRGLFDDDWDHKYAQGLPL